MNTFNFKSTRIAKMCKALFVILTCSQATAFAQACDASSHLMQTTTVTDCTGYLYDSGGGGSVYQPGENYSFTISPVGATEITVKLLQLTTEPTWDWIRFKDASGTVIWGPFSGSSLPATSEQTWTLSSVTVEFHSDGTLQYNGFQLLWTTIGGSCGNRFNISNGNTTSYRGTLHDSGGRFGNYADNESKVFTLAPIGASFVCIKFSEFNTESGADFVKIYDNVNATGTLLGSYSGTTIPAGNIISSTGKMSIKFTSDYSVVRSGWTAIWNSDGSYPFAYEQEARTIGNDNGLPAEDKLSIFPNPTDSKMSIAFHVKEQTQTKVVIYNIAGMETVVLDKTLQAGMQKIDFDATSLAPGMYFCKVVMGTTFLMEKVIKN